MTHGQQCCDAGSRGQNDNGKYTIKIKLKKKQSVTYEKLKVLIENDGTI